MARVIDLPRCILVSEHHLGFKHGLPHENVELDSYTNVTLKRLKTT